uniref:Beta-defensin n=1 Tax=Sarcophilus harrisii TaxID=9305 RepID=A0A7N4PPX0_SARHA
PFHSVILYFHDSGPIDLNNFFFCTVRSGFEDKVCGHGTALCRVKCLPNEIKIGKCPNAFPCCLKTFENHSLNTLKVNS